MYPPRFARTMVEMIEPTRSLPRPKFEVPILFVSEVRYRTCIGVDDSSVTYPICKLPRAYTYICLI